jgi:hypothetical protein
MTKSKVLVLGSNATRIEVQGGGTGPTGNYLNETVVPAMALIEAGYNLVLATPNGTKPHIDKASDSDISTGVLAELAQPGKPFYGIHGSNDGKIVIFGGGLPVRRKGIVIGAIGTSAGTVEQDIEVAEAAIGAIEPSIQSASVGVPSC